MEFRTKTEAQQQVATLEERAAGWHKAAKTPRDYFTTRREATHRALKAEQEAASLKKLLPTLPD